VRVIEHGTLDERAHPAKLIGEPTAMFMVANLVTILRECAPRTADSA